MRNVGDFSPDAMPAQEADDQDEMDQLWKRLRENEAQKSNALPTRDADDNQDEMDQLWSKLREHDKQKLSARESLTDRPKEAVSSKKGLATQESWAER